MTDPATVSFDDFQELLDKLSDVTDAIEDDVPWEEVRRLLDRMCNNPALQVVCAACTEWRKRAGE